MTDDLNQTWVAEAIAAAVQSPFRDTAQNFASALVQNGAMTEDESNAYAAHVPELMEDLLEALAKSEGNYFDEDRMKASMSVLDLMYIGLLFHTYQQYFIAPDEEAEDDDAPDR